MKSKVARRLLRERDALREKAASAQAELNEVTLAVEGEARSRDEHRARHEALVERIRVAREALLADEHEQFVIEERLSNLEWLVAVGGTERERLRRVAEGLAERAEDQRFRSAEECLARAAESRVAQEGPRAREPLSPENVEGLIFLRRAFRLGGTLIEDVPGGDE